MGEPSDFVTRAPWWGADLQTLRNTIRPPRVPPCPAPERVDLALPDGDTLIGRLHPGAADRPLVVLAHGLGGHEDSIYMQRTASHFANAGQRVLRLNLRGAGPSRALCADQYHAGRSDDFARALRALPEDALSAGVLAIGYSLGGNMLLKFLGEGAHGLPVRAAASVSAPIDLHRACRRIQERRNWVYHRYLLGKLRAQTLASPPGSRMSALHDVARSAPTLFDFDDRVVAHLGGFDGALDYYARCSAQEYLAKIEVPTLVIHARNDPWIPVESYDAVPWSRNPALEPLIPLGGGHVGFHDAAHEASWHDRAIESFFARQ